MVPAILAICWASSRTSPSQPSSVTSSPGPSDGGMGEVDRGQIHRHRAENRSQLTGRDHVAAIRKPVEDAVRVTRSEDADPHGAGARNEPP